MKEEHYILAVIISTIAIGAAMFGLGYAIGANNGATKGYDRGFDACIEENNLYDRYE